MAITLNEMVSILSDRVGKPFNVPLQEELKTIITYKRINYMQQLLEKHPDQRRFFNQQFTVPLEKVSADAPVCGITTSKECPIMKTKCEVPQPIRGSYTLFDYVGEGDFSKSYGYAQPEFIDIMKYNTYTSKHPRWFFVDKHIYVYKNLTTKFVGIRGVFEDPFQINNCCDGKQCFTDDTAFPAPQDIINAIMRDILNVELRNQFPNFGEVLVDDKQPQETGK